MLIHNLFLYNLKYIDKYISNNYYITNQEDIQNI